MNFVNLCTSPPVASASAAAEANGVWTPGRASAISAPASSTRSLRRRFSLLEYAEEASATSTPVTTRPTTVTARAGQYAQRPFAPADGRSSPRSPSAVASLGGSAATDTGALSIIVTPPPSGGKGPAPP